MTISDLGQNTLNLFKSRISESVISVKDDYFKERLCNIRNQITVTADYIIERNDNFIVCFESNGKQFNSYWLKVNVPSKKEAVNICAKWKSNSSEVYNGIIQILIKN